MMKQFAMGVFLWWAVWRWTTPVGQPDLNVLVGPFVSQEQCAYVAASAGLSRYGYLWTGCRWLQNDEGWY